MLCLRRRYFKEIAALSLNGEGREGGPTDPQAEGGTEGRREGGDTENAIFAPTARGSFSVTKRPRPTKRGTKEGDRGRRRCLRSAHHGTELTSDYREAVSNEGVSATHIFHKIGDLR